MDLTKFKHVSVLVVGDLMIDEYVWGDVDRISPEAPVQIVSVYNEDVTLGGAGNVVKNLVELGASVFVAGIIGNDASGKLAVDMFNHLGVNTKGISADSARPTTRKTRIIATNQHVLRIDRETQDEISQSARESLSDFIDHMVPQTDIVLVSDYGKGVVTRSLMTRLVDTGKKYQKTVLVDPKGLDFSKYQGVSLIKPNKKEASLASGIDITDRSALIKAGKKIMETTGIDALLVTCGQEGMVLFQTDQSPHTIPSQARQVYDVSGAGDTVLAVMGLAIASGASFQDAAAAANTAAGIVVGKVGTASVSMNELNHALSPHPSSLNSKHQPIDELPGLIQGLKQEGKKIVLTNGCFDLLHAGHVLLFSASKQLGDVLMVAIDDDESVKKVKGPGRPVINAKQRVDILSAIDSIDYVIVFSSHKLNDLIEMIRPDILTKGANYTSEEVLGLNMVERCGGRVVLVPVGDEISSTGIIDMIKNQ